MNVEIIKDEKNFLEVMLPGEDLGFANLVVEIMLSQDGVFAAASADHPIKGNPIIRIKSKDPKKVLSKALAETKKALSTASTAAKKI